MKQKHPDAVLKGRDLFDASLFRNPVSTSVFYSFIAGLKQAIDGASPSHTHRFIKALDAKGRLLRSYTQNIDGLEERAGLLSSSSQDAKAPSPSKAKGKARAKLKIKDVRNVQLHGDVHRVRCTVCSADYPCSMPYLEMFTQGFPPDCPDCTTRCEWLNIFVVLWTDSNLSAQARVARSARALKVGTLRPAIVLYDEPHPLGDEIGQIQAADVRKGPDLLIVMGTSLKVHGLKKLVKEFAKVTHARKGPKTPGIVIFVNKTPPGSEWEGVIDYHVEGDTDLWTEKVVADWKKHKPTDWEHQTTLVEGLSPFRISNGVLGGKFLAIFLGDVSLTSSSGIKSYKENVAPKPVMASSSPLSTPPSSPSKRRGSTSHYSDLESSPSKRRGVTEKMTSKMTEGERKPLFTSEVANTLVPMRVEREPVYQTPVRKGRVADMLVGSPMHVDGEEGVRKSIPDLFGSPMKVDRPGVAEGGPLQEPLPRLEVFVEIPIRNRVRGRPVVAS